MPGSTLVSSQQIPYLTLKFSVHENLVYVSPDFFKTFPRPIIGLEVYLRRQLIFPSFLACFPSFVKQGRDEVMPFQFNTAIDHHGNF